MVLITCGVVLLAVAVKCVNGGMVKVVGQNCVGKVGVAGVVNTGGCTNGAGCGAAVEDAQCGNGVVAWECGDCWVCVVGV